MATIFNYAAAIALALIAGFAFAFPVAAQVEAALDTGVSLDSGPDGMNAGADARATTSVATDPHAEGTEEHAHEPFTILRSSLGAGAQTAPATADAVATDADLNAYASGVMRADDRIEAVAFTDEKVEVRYGAPGRLLGIFPITMTVRAEVASDGTVAVSYPWYRFLVASDGGADIESELSSRIDAATLSSGTSLTVAAKARLVDEIRAALPEASVSADASASGAAR